MEDIHKDTFKAEDCRAELSQATAKLNESNELVKKLKELLEYEEALTVDTRSQQRIGSKLRELGLWPSNKQ